ncbi:MAG: ABC transporter permease [Lachnospiraceae bacterium]|nr:ABC transporter permease [Lachnospiraceae bacterium]
MKFRDMLRMSVASLWKRKVRTILTILGVIIGTASIVVMISLGLGLKRSSMEEIEQYGGLTTISVMEKDSYEMDEGGGNGSGKNKTVQHLDDSVVSMLSQLEHVEYVCPVMDGEMLALYGGYTCYVNLRGVPSEMMEQLGLKLKEGTFPEPGSTELSFIYGNSVIADFNNDKTMSGYWYNGELPDIDLMTDPVMYVFDTEKYYNFIWGVAEEDGQAVAMPKKYMLKTSGILEGEIDDYDSNSNLVYCDLDNLKKILKKEFRNKPIPGQPTTASGKPMKEMYYTSILVGVDDMDEVKNVQTQISQLGFAGESNAEWVESMQGQYRYIQLALGGIGAVSLLVAAIGIANTMMMSIYERTKEIGIMKVLGCDMRNIQAMFLMEAGYIGLIGGVIGTGLSCALSMVINAVMKNMDMVADLRATSGISYVPVWLMLMAIGFAVVVGMAAGFFPSLRAMRLSPLAAIRNE